LGGKDSNEEFWAYLLMEKLENTIMFFIVTVAEWNRRMGLPALKRFLGRQTGFVFSWSSSIAG
jgi:hypothetical protein